MKENARKTCQNSPNHPYTPQNEAEFDIGVG